jgi:[DsrC]-trisulfide reductase subunit M
MRALSALLIVAVLLGVVWLGAGVAGWHAVFGVAIPYAAVLIFLVGLVWRVVTWARSPVPFRIPTTCGQQRSLPWISSSTLESPHNGWGVTRRLALEVLLFRSLFRNTRTELTPAKRLVYESDKYLWVAALAFHWSFLLIFLRHLRFFLQPVPQLVSFLEGLDGFFQLAVPTLFLSDLVILAALLYLLGRRLINSQLRYISLPADYFALFLLLAVAVSGVLMRYVTRVDLVAAKELAMGLVTFSPKVPAAIGTPFYIHIFFVSLLFAYFPFSKLTHMAGVFLSPTRNLANNNRARRHVNPWNPEVEVHTYAQWEADFHDKLVAAGIPLDKE